VYLNKVFRYSDVTCVLATSVCQFKWTLKAHHYFELQAGMLCVGSIVTANLTSCVWPQWRSQGSELGCAVVHRGSAGPKFPQRRPEALVEAWVNAPRSERDSHSLQQTNIANQYRTLIKQHPNWLTVNLDLWPTLYPTHSTPSLPPQKKCESLQIPRPVVAQVGWATVPLPSVWTYRQGWFCRRFAGFDHLYEINKKLSYCSETVRRESMPRVAEMHVEMTS